MMDRKTFLAGSLAAAGTLAAWRLNMLAATPETRSIKIKTTDPKKGAVIWYSQTGNTRRYGRLIAHTWKKSGLTVTASDYRDIDPAILPGMDVIAMGSPVYYYEVPVNFRTWIASLPRLDGIPAASYVTFGGEGGNQYNTVTGLLQSLGALGGVPVAMGLFGNMSAFAPTWSMGNTERILQYRHLPEGGTYERVSLFAATVLNNVKSGTGITVAKKSDYRELFKGSFSIWGTKLFISNHHINAKTCTGCGTCVEKCPVEAVSLAPHHINTSRCIACFGCVNNCPAGAMEMSFMGKKVYGYREFMKRNGITITEPAGLKNS